LWVDNEVGAGADGSRRRNLPGSSVMIVEGMRSGRTGRRLFSLPRIARQTKMKYCGRAGRPVQREFHALIAGQFGGGDLARHAL
jgi:hypothetical protein